MSRRPPIIVLALVALLAVLAPLAAPERPPLWVWNPSASAPIGLWRIAPGAPVDVGDWVLVDPPADLAAWLDAADYLPAGLPLVKRLAARGPSVVCRHGTTVRLDGRVVARARSRDHLGRPLPVWSGCRRLEPDEIVLFTAHPASLDSRYFGVIPADRIIGRATPVWTR
ncbi:hypothetical protein BZG35_08510 [Brevundimonas sp. LM2]|uniref:S26 family signal peptidase n=1 Tax=Brevundimonas sp. LM2 TaxID=1938605 RepID=UPI000983BB8C|nr:S26 family signal peptidase [Brevundimonas sp. LM2]AQR61688.1 hypothetical protein BZG35_08510 [Brevundimonas sp. LM2]